MNGSDTPFRGKRVEHGKTCNSSEMGYWAIKQPGGALVASGVEETEYGGNLRSGLNVTENRQLCGRDGTGRIEA